MIAWAVCIGVGLLAGEIAGAALFYAEHGGLIYRNQLSPGKESVVESAVRYRQRRSRHSRVKSSTTVRIRNRRPWISVFAFVCDRITQHLKAGAETSETLMMGERGRDIAIVHSLRRSARAFVRTKQYAEALQRITEAKELYGKSKQPAFEETLDQINLEIDCYRGLQQKDRLIEATSEGIDLCEQAICDGVMTSAFALRPRRQF